MSAIVQERKLSGPATLGLALLLVAPSAVALFASAALVHRARFPASALWLVYEVSLYAGCAGVGAAAIGTAVEAVRRQISPEFRWLMGVSAALGIFLLWYARHIYQNPWAPNT
ncbi:MAG TPA: hypothetical protein VN822_06345 [Candidatus Acidoferrales bacterium]|nr:hypothetical protein [Candidatus Acidoferrales bacterium]